MAQRRIFIVEDDDYDIQRIQEAFEDIDAHLEFARDGETAIRDLNQWHEDGLHPDLIVLDIELPGQSGLSVLRRLRKSHFSSTPVIMFTGSESLIEREEAEALGISAYVSKPLELSGYVRFGETVKRLLTAEQGAKNSDARQQPTGRSPG